MTEALLAEVSIKCDTHARWMPQEGEPPARWIVRGPCACFVDLCCDSCATTWRVARLTRDWVLKCECASHADYPASVITITRIASRA